MASWNKMFSRWLIGLAIAAMAWPWTAAGQDFRVDTEMFQNQEKAPYFQTLTIFAEGIVYDFCLTEPLEATVFDPRNGRFTLLDEKRKVKATVRTQELLDFCLALEDQAAKEKDRLFSFCAVPQFETTEKEIERNGQMHVELRMAGKPLTYVALGQRPERKEAVGAYRHFTDWCARLNATRPGNLPPGARLALNQALAEHELLPLEISRTTAADLPFGRKLEIKSQHLVNWTLSGEDRKKIDRAADMMAAFRTISYDEYRNPAKKPSDAKQVRR
jgi:hypothetical protein